MHTRAEAISTGSCEHISLVDLHDGFCRAFSDYSVAMQPSISEFRLMLAQRGFDATLSWAALAGRSVVSFWLIGHDPTSCNRSAYVIASGTVPDFRGRGLAEDLHRRLQQSFVRYGINSVQLEVITSNKPARSLYAKLGYVSVRDLCCFEVARTAIRIASVGQADIAECAVSDVLALAPIFRDWQPSWQNGIRSLSRIHGELVCIAARINGDPVAYGVLIKPANTIAQLAVRDDRRRCGIGSAVLHALATASPRHVLKIINADSRDTGFQAFLTHHGAQTGITQLEMVVRL
ncbi:MAG: GNAT family N-acetyltransferase [Pseudomonadota bacterium]